MHFALNRPNVTLMNYGMLLVAALSTASLASAQGTFHADNARTGVFPGPGPTQLTGVKWTFKSAGPIVTSPTVADGVVYIASLSGHLYAVDEQSGKEKWQFKSRAPIASSPAVSGDVLYFVSSAGSLAALDRNSGQPKWVYAIEFERKFEAKGLHGYQPATQTIPDAWDLFTSSPAVTNGKVFFGAGDGNVYAVDARSGLLQWKFATQDVVHTSPAVVGNTLYIGSWDSRVYALDTETGQQRWVFQAGLDPVLHNQVGFQSSPAVVDGTLYIGCRDAHVYALDAATGKKKWDYPTSKSWVIGTPAVHGGMVYVGTSDSARFMALDAKTGRLRFNVDAKAYVFSSAAIAGGVAYFGSHNGKLYAIDTANGKPLWEFQTEASKRDELDALNPDGSLRTDAFAPLFSDFQDMYLDLLRYRSVGAIVSSPAVHAGVVYVGSLDGNLYALH
jgi:eukaryotic-like serine/threonine-protein kinase